MKKWFALALALTSTIIVNVRAADGPVKVTINDDHVLQINGKSVFPICFTLPPDPNAKAPNGKPAYEELRDAGALFMRTGPMKGASDADWGGDWDDKWIAQ